MVFGATDELWGYRVCAAVVGSVTSAEIVRHCGEQIAPHKPPKQVVIVSELPLTANETVRRSTLADELGISPTGCQPGSGDLSAGGDFRGVGRERGCRRCRC